MAFRTYSPAALDLAPSRSAAYAIQERLHISDQQPFQPKRIYKLASWSNRNHKVRANISFAGADMVKCASW